MEDLRSALQGSDARCLALEVALRRERATTLPTNHSNVATPNMLPLSNTKRLTPPKVATPNTQRGVAVIPKPQGRGCGVGREETVVKRVTERRGTRDPLLRELKLIRSSRDGQLEEAIRFNQSLEEELGWAYQQARRLEAVESRLRKDNAEIRLVFD